MIDEKSLKYFDNATPEYSLARFEPALLFLNETAKNSDTLIDIGCGNGNFLELILEKTPIMSVTGIDFSSKYLEQTVKRIGCSTYCGSILDGNFINTIDVKYDYAFLSALLHHVVGSTRKESWNNAIKAVENTILLLKEGGYLIIQEPAFYPSIIMTIVFWIKRIISSMTSSRVNIFGYWNNIGEPVVSYYTNEQLKKGFSTIPGINIIGEKLNETPLNIVLRLAMIRKRTDSTFFLQKIL